MKAEQIVDASKQAAADADQDRKRDAVVRAARTARLAVSGSQRAVAIERMFDAVDALDGVTATVER